MFGKLYMVSAHFVTLQFTLPILPFKKYNFNNISRNYRIYNKHKLISLFLIFSVPPTNNQQDNQSAPEPEPEPEELVKPSCCSRLFGSCCGKMCGCCKKTPTDNPDQVKPDKMETNPEEEMPKTKSCFSCCKRKPKEGDEPIVEVEPEEKPPGCWKKMKCKNCFKGCCKRNKVADTREKTPGCFDKMKKKKKNEDNWAERRDSIMSNGDEK